MWGCVVELRGFVLHLLAVGRGALCEGISCYRTGKCGLGRVYYVGIEIVGVVRGWNALFWRRPDGAGSWAGVRLLGQSLPGGFLVREGGLFCA